MKLGLAIAFCCISVTLSASLSRVSNERRNNIGRRQTEDQQLRNLLKLLAQKNIRRGQPKNFFMQSDQTSQQDEISQQDETSMFQQSINDEVILNDQQSDQDTQLQWLESAIQQQNDENQQQMISQNDEQQLSAMDDDDLQSIIQQLNDQMSRKNSMKNTESRHKSISRISKRNNLKMNDDLSDEDLDLELIQNQSDETQQVQDDEIQKLLQDQNQNDEVQQILRKFGMKNNANAAQ